MPPGQSACASASMQACPAPVRTRGSRLCTCPAVPRPIPGAPPRRGSPRFPPSRHLLPCLLTGEAGDPGGTLSPRPTDRGLPGRPVPSHPQPLTSGRGRPLSPPRRVCPPGPGGGGEEEEKKRGGRSPRSYKSFPGEEQWFIPRRGHHAPEETRGQAAQHRLGRGARPRGPLPGEEASAHRAFPQRLRPAG